MIGIFLVIGLLFLKAEHQTRRVKVIVVVVIGFLLYFSIVGVFSSGDVDLGSPRGVTNAIYVYFGWIGHAASGLWDAGVETVHMVGNAVKMDDDPEEEEDDERR